jgi:hypothetical protein
MSRCENFDYVIAILRGISEIVGETPKKICSARLLDTFKDFEHWHGISGGRAEDESYIIALRDERVQLIADFVQQLPHVS